MLIVLDEIGQAVDDLGFAVEMGLELDLYVFMCLWFTGAVIPAASC